MATTQTIWQSAEPRNPVAVLTVIAGCLAIGLPGVASAQDERSVGLSMGYPTGAGVLWQASERVAIRPEVTFSWSSTEFSSGAGTTGFFGGGILPSLTYTTTTEGNNVGFGVSVLLTVHQRDALRVYLAPAVGYTRSTTTSTPSLPDALPGGFPPELLRLLPVSVETTSSGYTAGVSVGAQYGLGDRFAVFGELGGRYSQVDTATESLIPAGERRGRSAGIRSAAGVVLYF